MCVQSSKINIDESFEDWNWIQGELIDNLRMHEPISQPSKYGTLNLEDACC